MTSQVNPNNIDGTYPVAGQDNDSQGFRDNFTNIRNNFTFTKAELEDLQNKVVLKSALQNTTLSNDFAGEAIDNPRLKSWRETYNPIGSASGSVTINFVNGNFQKLTMSGSTTLVFSFPTNTANQYASIKLWVNITNSSWTLTLPSGVSQNVSLNNPSSVSGYAGGVITFTAEQISNNNDYFFEFFTVDGGTTIGIIDHTRNRDISLTGTSFSGPFTANGLVTLGSGSSNVVVAATTGSTSSTTGALVVTGGAGIASNVHIDGNLWVNSGNIRTSGTTGNIFNVSATTVSVGNAATSIFMGASTSTITTGGSLRIGANLNLATGSTSTIPILFGVGITGGNVAGVQQGALEANLGVGGTGTASNVLMFAPTNSTSSGEALVPVTHYAVLGSNVAVNNGTNPAGTTSYSMFGGPVAAGAHLGNVMLAAGTTYEFDVHSMVSFAAAPTASTIGFTFGGNASTTYYSYEVQSYPVSGTGGLNQGNTSHWYGTTAFPVTSSVVLNTQAYFNFAIRARGLVRTNTQGTLLPLIQWNTAPAQVATVVQGSYAKFTPLGTQANIVIGTTMGSPFAP